MSAGHIRRFPPVASHRLSRPHPPALHPPIAPAPPATSAGCLQSPVGLFQLPVSHPSQPCFLLSPVGLLRRSSPSVLSVGRRCRSFPSVIAVGPLRPSSPSVLSVGHLRRPHPPAPSLPGPSSLRVSSWPSRARSCSEPSSPIAPVVAIGPHRRPHRRPLPSATAVNTIHRRQASMRTSMRAELIPRSRRCQPPHSPSPHRPPGTTARKCVARGNTITQKRVLLHP